jgi:RNA polymerase sigma-70 factor (ECF subfamily)
VGIACDIADRRTVHGPPAAADFDALYDARYGDVVAMVYASRGAGPRPGSVLPRQRWAVVSEYNEPLAWILRVAANLATSRWRRGKVVRAHLRRQQRAADVPPLNPRLRRPGRGARRLPADQRRAVVLHYLIDLPVADVAREMDAAVGTVKSMAAPRAYGARRRADPGQRGGEQP